MLNFFHKILSVFDTKNLKPSIKRIMKPGIRVSFILMLFSTLLLALYIQFSFPAYLYDIGSLLFKSSSTFVVYFLICGVCFNKIANDAGIQ